jgi:hypothetical protein
MPKNIIIVDGNSYRVDDVTGKIEIIEYKTPTKEQERKVIAELAKKASAGMKTILEDV